MASGLDLSGAGMVTAQSRHDAVSENVANLSTPGFKATRVFSEVLGEVQAGTGALHDLARGQRTFTDFSQGVVDPTGRDLDVALEGDGFFVLGTPAGERYTRNGSFTLDADGRLVDGDGNPVLTTAGPLVIQGGRLRIEPTGDVFVDGYAAGRLRLAQFAAPENLVREGHCRFATRAGIGPLPAPAPARVRQGSLERSNVEGVEEMVRMISLLRQFESAQRAFKLQNDALGRVVNELVQR